jgi:hypothetical protein
MAFLDANGVSFLWSQLSLQDYPNNDTLIAVLNAIDETKADKTYVDEQIAALVDSAPETLNTLGELASAFQENDGIVTLLNDAITSKQDVITGTSGQFVIIGTDGRTTTATIPFAEDRSF